MLYQFETCTYSLSDYVYLCCVFSFYAFMCVCVFMLGPVVVLYTAVIIFAQLLCVSMFSQYSALWLQVHFLV